ncbi:uncharacterized protein LOC133739604 [Rosa rugosa]|uniref:uncharacterized protein LOC133739604 n=1 Tax=Rosa rugosa TaxID=74645 RepID=UPI002B4113DF|nr:uncharacterized protein LOC133739604 [Rosa rugosa]XP_062023373.1 uncharacterized protein LOC133739604 [Rosa rugosa]
MAKKMVATVSPLRWLEIVTEERVSSRSTLSRGVLVSFLFITQPPPPSPNDTEPSSSSFSASDHNPSKNEEEREVGCEGLGLKDGGCSRVQGLCFRDELEQLRKKSGAIDQALLFPCQVDEGGICQNTPIRGSLLTGKILRLLLLCWSSTPPLVSSRKIMRVMLQQLSWLVLLLKPRQTQGLPALLEHFS